MTKKEKQLEEKLKVREYLLELSTAIKSLSEEMMFLINHAEKTDKEILELKENYRKIFPILVCKND